MHVVDEVHTTSCCRCDTLVIFDTCDSCDSLVTCIYCDTSVVDVINATRVIHYKCIRCDSCITSKYQHHEKVRSSLLE